MGRDTGFMRYGQVSVDKIPNGHETVDRVGERFPKLSHVRTFPDRLHLRPLLVSRLFTVPYFLVRS